MLTNKKLMNKIIIGLAAITVNTVNADDWSFNEFNNITSGYIESRLSVTSKDLTTALELICNQYGVQLLVTGTSWHPAFYEHGVAWFGDNNQGGLLDMPPTDSKAGLNGAWQALTDKQPRNLLNAINTSEYLTFRFKIAGVFQNRVLDTTDAGSSAAKFLDACLL
tara:strand:- start:90 stop:584 length:495 start_codon:yes stop_codon:yes gene_type:complete